MKKLIVVATILFMSTANSPGAEKVLAVVNGKKITESQLDGTIDKFPNKYRNLKDDPKFRKMVLENMVKEELLLQQAKKENLESDPKVKEEIRIAKRRILVQALISKHVPPQKVSVTEKEAMEFYKKNKDQFKDPNGKQIPFEALKPFIVQSLKQQKEAEAYREAVEKYIQELKKENKVEIMVN